MGHSPWAKKIFFIIWGAVILFLVGIIGFCVVGVLRPSGDEIAGTTETGVRSAEVSVTETGTTEAKTTETRTSEAKTTEAKSTETRTTEAKSTEAKSTEKRTTEAKSTEVKTGENSGSVQAVERTDESGYGPSFLPWEFEFPATGGNPEEGSWKLAKGKSYHIGADGQPLKDQIISWRGNSYYLDADGVLAVAEKRIITDGLYEISKFGILTTQTGWVEIGGKRYYGDSEGKVVRNRRITEGGAEYFLNQEGVLVTDRTFQIEGKLYQADKDGKLEITTGWTEINGTWYYGETNGSMAKERQISKDGALCYVGADGKIVTDDFYYYNGDLYFADKDGKLRKSEGWFHWNKRWYYSDSDGKFVHDDYIKVDKEKYYMDSTGARIVGKPTIDMYLKCPGIYDWMTSHHTDYYFKTNYTSLKYHSGHPEELIRPYGEYGEESSMNCTGFISSLVYYSGGDLDRVSAMGRYMGYGNGDNYLNLATKGYVRYDVFRSARALLQSGKAHKGDIMYLAPVWGTGDCHMGVFWGDTSSENALWSQTLRTKCTVTEIYMVDPVNQIYYFPISRNTTIEYYEGDTP